MNPLLDWIVSVDDHVIEPPNLWVDRAASGDRDRVPHVERIDGIDTWIYEHHRTPIPGIMVCADKEPGDFDPMPVNYEDMRPGYYDSVARVADMDTDGVLAQACYPTFGRFCGQAFLETKDKDLALRCLRTYNDWLIDEWAGAVPGRQIPLMMIPLWDPVAGASEIERCADKGAKGILFSENPYRLGLPSIHDRDGYWDPVLAAANETEMPLCTHIGSSSFVPVTSPDAPMAVGSIIINLNLAAPAVDWLYSGQFQRYPNLKLMLAEGGIGWIPFVLERAHHVSTVYRYLSKISGPTENDGQVTFEYSDLAAAKFTDDPIALFHDHIFGCFIEDDFGARNLDDIGIDNVMIETDYPHSDSLWPHSIAAAHRALEGRSDEDKYKVLQGNALRVLNFTPAPYPNLEGPERVAS
jgi:predicted TIM-barrel fold metal-dependent hydrolase